MTTWTSDELDKIEKTEELQIASLREDGTLRRPRTIWVVRVDGELYVRSVNGRGSDWFSGVLTRHTGRIQAGGVDKDVTFEEIDANQAIHDQIDVAYRTKYHRYAENIVDSTVTLKAKSATIKLLPLS